MSSYPQLTCALWISKIYIGRNLFVTTGNLKMINSFIIDQQYLIKRIKSFLWRGAMVGLAFMFAWLAENVGLLEVDATITTILGLVLGEVSKWLNTKKYEKSKK